MADKQQYDKNQSNIETVVPKEQELRDAKKTTEIDQSASTIDNVIDTADTFTPVIKVTKHEAVLTKGDLKLQRVTVKEDISINYQHLFLKKTLPGNKTVVTESSEQNGHTGNELLVEEVPKVQHLRVSTNEEEDTGRNEDKKLKTRIPTLRFRQAFDKLKERRQSAEKESQIVANPKRRTSIPKLIGKNKHPNELKSKQNDPKIPVEDEFEKIYDEIVVHETKDLVDEPKVDEIISDIKEPEEKFEEVVHAYEENKIQPVEKPKSKIPLKKSESEMQVPKVRPMLRKSISVDRTKQEKRRAYQHPGEDVIKSSNTTYNSNNITNEKLFIEIEEPKLMISNVVEVVELESNVETINKNTCHINEIPDYVTSDVEPDIPIKENKYLQSEQYHNISNEIPYVPSEHISNDNDSEIPVQEISPPSELNHNNNDINEPLRGKVSRLISKIDSNKFENNDKKITVAVHDIPKKVSVLTKISMFEQVNSKDHISPGTPPPTPTFYDKPKISQKTSYEQQRPIIVQEIYKAPLHEIPKNCTDYSNNDDITLDDNQNLIVSAESKVIEVTETNNDDVKAEVKEALNSDVVYNDKSNVIDADKKAISYKELRLHRLISRQDERFRKTASVTDLDRNSTVEDTRRFDSNDVFGEKIETTYARLGKTSVSDKIALFEKKLTPVLTDYQKDTPARKVIDLKPKINSHPSKSVFSKSTPSLSKATSSLNIVEKKKTMSEDEYAAKIDELRTAKIKYGVFKDMKYVELNNGELMPVIALGTALLDPVLSHHIITAAIDLGYRAIDTAYVYGNERSVGEAIRAKIEDGTVTREELFIINKLWSTFHRTDLVEAACRSSLEAMGLDYFDLYLIHNPMSFKEGSNPIPKIANVLQFSSHNYLDAWFGMEALVSKQLVKSIGVSNFNSAQINRLVEKARIKPVINQVESHPYLNQHRLADACLVHDVVLMSYACLGSAGSEQLRAPMTAAIEDSVVKLAAAGLAVSPAQLLLRYQLEMGRAVVTKASSGERLWNNLLSLVVDLDPNELTALNALNKNKRMFTFKGMGDTHRNYPFNIPF